MSDIAVMGATGHTGSVIARNLLALGHRVRAMGRSAERLDALRQQGGRCTWVMPPTRPTSAEPSKAPTPSTP